MKERPILFNTDMVKAILDGRKTQTRRPVKKEVTEYIEHMAGSNDEGTEFDFLQLEYGQVKLDNGKIEAPQWLIVCSEYPEEGVIPIGQQFGAVGDRLWVRETWQGPLVNQEDEGAFMVDREGFQNPKYCSYKASGDSCEFYDIELGELVCRWKPSIHMPRWVCRLELEITNVRLERVQDITEDDAKAEGTITEEMTAKAGLSWRFGDRKQFQDMWDKVYPNSWAKNEWVWVIEFKIAELNGKKLEQAA